MPDLRSVREALGGLLVRAEPPTAAPWHSITQAGHTVHVQAAPAGLVIAGPAPLLGASLDHLPSLPGERTVFASPPGQEPPGAHAHPSYKEGAAEPLTPQQSHLGLAHAIIQLADRAPDAPPPDLAATVARRLVRGSPGERAAAASSRPHLGALVPDPSDLLPAQTPAEQIVVIAQHVRADDPHKALDGALKHIASRLGGDQHGGPHHRALPPLHELCAALGRLPTLADLMERPRSEEPGHDRVD